MARLKLKRVVDLIEVGKPCVLECIEDGTVVIEAHWHDGPAGYGWALFANDGAPLHAAQDVLLDPNWRIKP